MFVVDVYALLLLCYGLKTDFGLKVCIYPVLLYVAKCWNLDDVRRVSPVSTLF